MELLALNERSIFVKSKMANLDLTLSTSQSELSALEEESYSIFAKLLLSHPFPEDVFWFYSSKEKLAHDIAPKVMPLADTETLEYFGQRLFMAFEILETLLIAFEEKKMSRKIFARVLKSQPKENFVLAFQLLEKSAEAQKRDRNFQALLSEAIQYSISVF